MSTDPDNYECCANGDCSDDKVCLKGNGQNVCFDCHNVQSNCQYYWNDSTLLKDIPNRCSNKSCKLNKNCNKSPLSRNNCNSSKSDCPSRVQQDSDNGFWHACYKDGSKCKVNQNAGWCDPNTDSQWAP